MSLAKLSKIEREELLARGLDERELYFVENLIAKKQVVLLEEMLARSSGGKFPLPTVIRDAQGALMRDTRLLVLRRKPYSMAHFKSVMVRAVWRRKNGQVVREAL